MSQSAQDNKISTNLGFTSVQAYTLAIITLVIGIAVGYFARGSAPARQSPGSGTIRTAPQRQPAAPEWASGQLPGIGTQQQGATSPEMLAQAAQPLLAKLQANPKDFETLRQLGNICTTTARPIPRPSITTARRWQIDPKNPDVHHRSGHRLLVHRRSRQGHRGVQQVAGHSPQSSGHAVQPGNRDVAGQERPQGRGRGVGAVAEDESQLRPEGPGADVD